MSRAVRLLAVLAAVAVVVVALLMGDAAAEEFPIGLVAIVLAAVFAVAVLASSHQRKRAPGASRSIPAAPTSRTAAPVPPQLPPVDDAMRGVAEADLVSLGERIGALEIDVDLPTAPAEARTAYAAAVADYDVASLQARRATTTHELHEAARTIADARFRLQVATALLTGERPPRHGAPCFFDPRHGVSVDVVEHAGLFVPACAACAAAVASGGLPQVLTVVDDGVPKPYWRKPLWDAYYAGAQPTFADAAEDPRGLLVSLFRQRPRAVRRRGWSA